MARIGLTDLHENLHGIVFNSHLLAKLAEGTVVVADGRLQKRDDELTLVVEAVHSLEEAAGRPVPMKRKSSPLNGARRAEANGKPANGNGHLPAQIERTKRRIRIEIPRTPDRSRDLSRLEDVYALLRKFPGGDEAEIVVRNGKTATSIPLPDPLVSYSESLAQQVHALCADAQIQMAES